MNSESNYNKESTQINRRLEDFFTLHDEHRQEWLDSGVHRDLIELNVKSITGIDFFDICYPNPDRRNDGRLTDDFLRKYRRYEGTAGWLVDGVDPQTGQPMFWPRYKPTEGEILDHQTGKPIKYVSPLGIDSRLIYLRVSEAIWQRVSERSGVPMPDNYVVSDIGETPGFWPWVLENNVPMKAAEGEKKAGSLLTQGYATPAIPGIWNARRNPKNIEGKPKGEPFLVPDLAIFDTAGREITFCFDYDATPEKRTTTLRAAIETGKCFKNATVRIALLPGPQKGVDDFIITDGDIHTVFAAAKPLDAFPKEKDEPDPQSYANYEAWESQQEQIDGEFEKEQSRQWAEAQPDRTRGEWTRLSTLGLDRTIRKLTKEVCERYLNIDPDHDFLPGINAWASAMGTGKTHSMAKIVERFPEGNIFSYRNSLLINTCTRIPGVDFIHDLGGTGNGKADHLLKSHSDWTALCVDSIFKVRTKDVLVLEETSKLIDHLLRGATCKRERAAILKLFQKHIQAAKYIFLLDADLSDTDIRYIKSLASNKPIHIIKNTFKPWQWQVNWFVGSVKDDEEAKITPNDRSPIDARILDSIAAGQTPLIVSDSQVYCEMMDRLLGQMYSSSPPYRTGLRVDSFTKTDDAETINAFLADPNKWIEENNPAYLIISPTAESSLDITIEHFTDVYGVFCGTINSYSQNQMLGRYRVPVPRWVFVRERSMSDNGGSRSPFAKTTLKHLHQYETQTLHQLALDKYLKERSLNENDGSMFTLIKALNEIADFESETWRDEHLTAWSEYQARDNYQKSNLRQTLREMLEGKGHHITEILGTKQKTRCKDERESVLMERAGRIATAKDISIEEAREIQRNMQATTDERFAADKAFLRERLPGLTLSQDFIYWCKFDERGILNQLQNYFMWQNLGLSEQLDRQRWGKALDSHVFLSDIRTQSLELKIMRELELGNLLDGKERRADDPEVLAFHQRALAHAPQIKLAFGIVVKPDSDLNYLLKRILGKVAIKYQGKQYRDGDGHYRAYSAVLPETDADCRAVLAAYAIRYADFRQQSAPMATLSQTDNSIEITLFGQSVTNSEILPNIELEPINTTIKGLPPVEPDHPATTPLREGAVVRWVKRAVQVSIEWLALDNSIAMVRDIVTKQAFNVHPDELLLA